MRAVIAVIYSLIVASWACLGLFSAYAGITILKRDKKRDFWTVLAVGSSFVITLMAVHELIRLFTQLISWC